MSVLLVVANEATLHLELNTLKIKVFQISKSFGTWEENFHKDTNTSNNTLKTFGLKKLKAFNKHSFRCMSHLILLLALC